jgi:hypothetical protein
MFYGQPSPFNAAPSNASFNPVDPGVSFNLAPSSVAMNVGIPEVVSTQGGMCMLLML